MEGKVSMINCYDNYRSFFFWVHGGDPGNSQGQLANCQHCLGFSTVPGYNHLFSFWLCFWLCFCRGSLIALPWCIMPIRYHNWCPFSRLSRD